MKVLIIPEVDEEEVKIHHQYKRGVLSIYFSPDFIDSSSLEVYTQSGLTKDFEVKIYLPEEDLNE